MMSRIRLFALLAVLAATPVAAQPQRPPDAAFAAFQGKASLYSNLLMESRQIAIDMIDRIGVIHRAATDPVKAAAPFDTAWTTLMQARAQSLKARIDAAPPLSSAELVSFYPPGNPATAEAARLVEAYPAMIRDTYATAVGLIDRTAELGPAAQKGEEKAAQGLSGAMFKGMTAVVAAETLQLELGATTFMPSHPQHALAQSSAASNRAMIEFFSLMNNQAEGRGESLVGPARRIRALAEEGRDAAERIPALAASMLADLEAAAKADGKRLRPEDVAAVDSYRTSAANEVAISENLSTVAVTLAERGLDPRVEEAWAEVEALVERRFQLAERRRATIGQ